MTADTTNDTSAWPGAWPGDLLRAEPPSAVSPSASDWEESGAQTIHDLRNMLAVIVSGAHVLGKHASGGETARIADAMLRAAVAAGELAARLSAQSDDTVRPIRTGDVLRSAPGRQKRDRAFTGPAGPDPSSIPDGHGDGAAIA